MAIHGLCKDYANAVLARLPFAAKCRDCSSLRVRTQDRKPQRLSLLSGGERALTATALLFAFLAVKPSPFVLLDEVDAPLDGANVEKFTNLIKEFSERSQFLLITHNPVTMEAAPTWYGVTMREAGISSILSYRVPQEATQTETEQAVVLSREPAVVGVI